MKRAGRPSTLKVTSPHKHEPWTPDPSAGGAGRSTVGSGQPGGTVSCCGRASAIVCHGAFAPTNRCMTPASPRSQSRLPAGAYTSLPRNRGATEKQVGQKGRTPFSEDLYSATVSSPETQRKPLADAPTNVAKGAPWCFLHIEQ